jgi:hypothetical protein
MEQMKPEQRETCKIYIIVCRDLKKVMSERIEIFRIPGNKPQLDEVEVKKMQDKKDKNRGSCPYHEP